MKVYRNLAPSEQDCAVALGNFDGLHLGHRKVISLAVKEEANGLAPTVLTFAENPLCGLGGDPGGRLLPEGEKIRLLEEFGVRQLYILEFAAVRDMTAEDFVDRVLAGMCRAGQVCCGFNFTFGRGGRAGSDTLKKLCEARGIRTEIAGAVLSGGTPVSSTRIRGLIENGRVDEAAELLGRPFGYCSEVLPGRQLGRKLGTPTLNQAVPEGYVLPRFGVYATWVTLEGGKRYVGVTNVGVKPTVGSDAVLAETWMPDYTGPDLYGTTVRVSLLKFLRPEHKFQGLAELREEILKNGAQARVILRAAQNGDLQDESPVI